MSRARRPDRRRLRLPLAVGLLGLACSVVVAAGNTPHYVPAGVTAGQPAVWLATDGMRLAWADGTAVHVGGTGPGVPAAVVALSDTRGGVFAGGRLLVVGPGDARVGVIEPGSAAPRPESVDLEDLPDGSLAIGVMGDYLLVAGRDALAVYLMPPPSDHRMPAGVAGLEHHHAPHHAGHAERAGYRLVARVPLPAPATAVDAGIGTAFVLVADGTSLVSVDLSDPSRPRAAAPVALPEPAADLALNGARLHLVGEQGLRVLRLIDGAVADFGTLDAPVRGHAVEVTGRALRVAGPGGVSTFLDSSPLAAIHDVNVGNFFFDPADLSVAPGDTVRWTNTMGFHNVSSCSGQPAPNVCNGEVAAEPFRSGDPAFNPWTFEHTFTVVGVDPYHCETHSLTMRGTITVSAPAGPPPAVPDGSDGSAASARKLDAAGTTIEVDWDAVTCPDARDHQLVWGFGSQLPDTPGGIYGLSGAECAIGAPPYTWSLVPDPTSDPTRMLWWLLLATDAGTTEGSWGTDSAGSERNGPGAGGSSGQCGITAKDVTNACGL